MTTGLVTRTRLDVGDEERPCVVGSLLVRGGQAICSPAGVVPRAPLPGLGGGCWSGDTAAGLGSCLSHMSLREWPRAGTGAFSVSLTCR